MRLSNWRVAKRPSSSPGAMTVGLRALKPGDRAVRVEAVGDVDMKAANRRLRGELAADGVPDAGRFFYCSRGPTPAR